MYAGTFILIGVLVPMLLAAWPLVAAWRRRTFGVADLLLVLLPVPVFVAALLYFNSPAQVGLAIVIYPIAIQYALLLCLSLRVYVAPGMGMSLGRASWAALPVALAASFALGMFVPAWPE